MTGAVLSNSCFARDDRSGRMRGRSSCHWAWRLLLLAAGRANGAELTLAGAGSGVSFDGDARMSVTCLAKAVSWMWHAPVSFDAAAKWAANVTIGMHNVAQTCSHAGWDEPW